jgi:hypothetical protein
MVPNLARASRSVNARAVALLVVLCVALLAWGVLRVLHPSGALRLVPAQVPAEDDRAPRPRPTLEPEPFS